MPDVDDFLAHHGVKGMKWGVRRNRSVTVSKVKTTAVRGQKVKAEGGKGQKASADAVRAAVYRQKAKASTTDSLSNKELKALVERMNLEQQYARMTPPTNKQKINKFLSGLLLNQGKQHANKVANDFASKQVASMFAK